MGRRGARGGHNRGGGSGGNAGHRAAAPQLPNRQGGHQQSASDSVDGSPPQGFGVCVQTVSGAPAACPPSPGFGCSEEAPPHDASSGVTVTILPPDECQQRDNSPPPEGFGQQGAIMACGDCSGPTDDNSGSVIDGSVGTGATCCNGGSGISSPSTSPPVTGAFTAVGNGLVVPASGKSQLAAALAEARAKIAEYEADNERAAAAEVRTIKELGAVKLENDRLIAAVKELQQAVDEALSNAAAAESKVADAESRAVAAEAKIADVEASAVRERAGAEALHEQLASEAAAAEALQKQLEAVRQRLTDLDEERGKATEALVAAERRVLQLEAAAEAERAGAAAQTAALQQELSAAQERIAAADLALSEKEAHEKETRAAWQTEAEVARQELAQVKELNASLAARNTALLAVDTAHATWQSAARAEAQGLRDQLAALRAAYEMCEAGRTAAEAARSAAEGARDAAQQQLRESEAAAQRVAVQLEESEADKQDMAERFEAEKGRLEASLQERTADLQAVQQQLQESQAAAQRVAVQLEESGVERQRMAERFEAEKRGIRAYLQGRFQADRSALRAQCAAELVALGRRLQGEKELAVRGLRLSRDGVVQRLQEAERLLDNYQAQPDSHEAEAAALRVAVEIREGALQLLGAAGEEAKSGMIKAEAKLAACEAERASLQRQLQSATAAAAAACAETAAAKRAAAEGAKRLAARSRARVALMHGRLREEWAARVRAQAAPALAALRAEEAGILAMMGQPGRLVVPAAECAATAAAQQAKQAGRVGGDQQQKPEKIGQRLKQIFAFGGSR